MVPETLSAAAKADYDLEIDDHRALVLRLNALDVWLDQPPDKVRTWCRELGVFLGEINELLRPHFKREEKSPLFTELPISFPRFGNQLDRLMKEHEALAKSVEDIVRDLEDLDHPDEPHVREIACKTRLAIAMLRRHESEENEILQSAYCEDLGNCD